MSDNPHGKKRWYDQQATVSKSITLLETFPSDFQTILGESIIELAENEFNINEMMAELRSLGPEKVLSLFKSKSKRRATDQVSQVHRAMNYMFVLPEGPRIFIATHIIGIVSYFYEYFKMCKQEGIQPSANVARQVCRAYLQGDLQDPHIFLTIVRQQIQISTHYSFEYASKANLADTPMPATEFAAKNAEKQKAEAPHQEKVEASEEGLFVRKSRLPD
jgi:hypothetical protein